MKLSHIDHDRLLDFYREAYLKFGDIDARSVRWSTEKDQVTRFRALIQVDDREELENSTILDVGCGLGELYKYFLKEEIEVDYTGIDIVPEFINGAHRRFPGADFSVADIFDIDRHYDYVLASGALSFKVENNVDHYQQMIKKMYDIADVALAFNMLDISGHVNNDTYAAYHPEDIADFCHTLSNNVQILVDYLPQDFAVYMYKGK